MKTFEYYTGLIELHLDPPNSIEDSGFYETVLKVLIFEKLIWRHAELYIFKIISQKVPNQIKNKHQSYANYL